MSSDEQIERLIVEKGKTAPRVTMAQIEASILSEHYFTALQGAGDTDAVNLGLDGSNDDNALPAYALGLLTFCVLVLRNGFMVTGESACASPENFDPEIGRTIARRNARDKIWALEGYLLKSRLEAGTA